ncbi:hypothetical protein [Streptodolium elevatio]|uniref:Uncharacterized protein n=1 Tax=Streptodolium elevatio TaxID=3157996 RepID=A0ABV3DL88_9ACTN
MSSALGYIGRSGGDNKAGVHKIMLVSAVDDRPLVSHGRVYVVDRDADYPVQGDEILIGAVASVKPSALALLSAGNDFYPAVRLELWDGQPVLPPGRWDAVETTNLTLLHGKIRLANSVGMQYLEPGFAIPPGNYAVRVCCRGRERAPHGEEIPQHVPLDPQEHWLIQFSPESLTEF